MHHLRILSSAKSNVAKSWTTCQNNLNSTALKLARAYRITTTKSFASVLFNIPALKNMTMKERTSWVYFGKAVPNQRPFSLHSQSHTLKSQASLKSTSHAPKLHSRPIWNYCSQSSSFPSPCVSSTIMFYSVVFKVSNVCSDQHHQILAWEGIQR